MAAVSVSEKCTRTNRIANTACVYFFFNDLSNHESLSLPIRKCILTPPPQDCHKKITRTVDTTSVVWREAGVGG